MASVPVGIADSYVGREVFGARYGDVLDYALEMHWNVLLEGPTGSGKTTAVMAWAEKRKMPFYSTPSNVGIDPSQLFGKKTLVEGSVTWIDGPVTDLCRYGGVLLINELNFLPDRIATVLYSLLDERREIALLDNKGEVIKAHKRLLIVADMNPGYGGTHDLNHALRNRFRIQLPWDYDDGVEQSLVYSDSLRQMAKQLREEAKKGTYETPVSTNMLMEFEQLTVDFGLQFAVGNFLQHFAPDEQEAVKVVVQTWQANLEKDLAQEAEVPGGEAPFVFDGE